MEISRARAVPEAGSGLITRRRVPGRWIQRGHRRKQETDHAGRRNKTRRGLDGGLGLVDVTG